MFQHYQIHENLGSGTFATVSKAMHRATGRWYAIKTMERRRLKSNADVTAAPDAAYAREISILKELNHPRICKLKEVFYEAHTISECASEYTRQCGFSSQRRSRPRAG